MVVNVLEKASSTENGSFFFVCLQTLRGKPNLRGSVFLFIYVVVMGRVLPFSKKLGV
jgi:hypothetical protein